MYLEDKRDAVLSSLYLSKETYQLDANNFTM